MLITERTDELYKACRARDIPTICCLLKYGDNADALLGNLRSRDGNTLLYIVIMDEFVDVRRLLLEASAEEESKDAMKLEHPSKRQRPP